MKQVEIINTFYGTTAWGVSEALFVGGQKYPLSDATQRQVDIGNAVIVEDAQAEHERDDDAADEPSGEQRRPRGRPRNPQAPKP
jgi:hypothetical protein